MLVLECARLRAVLYDLGATQDRQANNRLAARAASNFRMQVLALLEVLFQGAGASGGFVARMGDGGAARAAARAEREST